jgi:hypothetical protein
LLLSVIPMAVAGAATEVGPHSETNPKCLWLARLPVENHHPRPLRHNVASSRTEFDDVMAVEDDLLLTMIFHRLQLRLHGGPAPSWTPVACIWAVGRVGVGVLHLRSVLAPHAATLSTMNSITFSVSMDPSKKASIFVHNRSRWDMIIS